MPKLILSPLLFLLSGTLLANNESDILAITNNLPYKLTDELLVKEVKTTPPKIINLIAILDYNKINTKIDFNYNLKSKVCLNKDISRLIDDNYSVGINYLRTNDPVFIVNKDICEKLSKNDQILQGENIVSKRKIAFNQIKDKTLNAFNQIKKLNIKDGNTIKSVDIKEPTSIRVNWLIPNINSTEYSKFSKSIESTSCMGYLMNLKQFGVEVMDGIKLEYTYNEGNERKKVLLANQLCSKYNK